MKKIILCLSFVFAGFIVVNAQCAKTASTACCAKKSSAVVPNTDVNGTMVASAVMSAEAVASADATIQKRECAESGTTTYYQKSTCSQSGKVSWNQVKFDESTNTFVAVASATMERGTEAKAEVKSDKKECATKTACCAKKTDN